MTEAKRHGRFRIAKQTGQTAHFASVAVTVEPAAADEVVLAADTRGWSEPVRRGITEALTALRSRRALEPVRVSLTELLAMVVDTRNADAEAAALLATLNAFLEPSMMPVAHFSYDEERWILDWPAP